MNFSDLRANERIMALGLIALGAIFLGSRLFEIDISGQLWPLFVIVPGLPFLYMALRGGKNLTMFMFPGLIITATGLVLLVQNTLNSFESWAYMWAIYPLLVGVGLRFQGRRTDNAAESRAGTALIAGGGAMLVAFGFLFEFVIFNSLFGGLTGLLLPALMIAAGVFWLYRRGALPVLDSLRGGEKPRREESAAPAAAEKPKNDAQQVDESPAPERRRESKRDPNEPFPWENNWAGLEEEADEQQDKKPRRRLTGDEDATIDPDLMRRIQSALSGEDDSEKQA
jgi:hypothetical protein